MSNSKKKIGHVRRAVQETVKRVTDIRGFQCEFPLRRLITFPLVLVANAVTHTRTQSTRVHTYLCPGNLFENLGLSVWERSENENLHKRESFAHVRPEPSSNFASVSIKSFPRRETHLGGFAEKSADVSQVKGKRCGDERKKETTRERTNGGRDETRKSVTEDRN